MVENNLNIWELINILNLSEDYDDLEYIITDFQKVRYGSNRLFVRKEKDNNIYAFINNDNSDEICLCKIYSKEQLIRLKESLLNNFPKENIQTGDKK